MSLSAKTIGRIESLVAVAKLSATEHNMLLRIVKDAVAEGTTNGRALAKVVPPDWPADYRDAFWAKYPNRKAKAHAMKALDKVAFAGKTAWADLINALERYIVSDDVIRGYAKHPATWLNAECWKDENGPAKIGTNGGSLGFFEIAAGIDR